MVDKKHYNSRNGVKILVALCIILSIVAKSQTDKKGTSLLNPQQSFYTGTKAIIVGISDYMNIQSLNYAHTDALNFYNFLISDAGGNVNPDNVILMLNEEATSANIYAALDWLVDEAKEGERIIIYFSGHGDLESKTIRQNGFLLGHDSPKFCYMAGGTISVRFLQDYLETIAIKCKSDILMITDACRSGKLAGGHEGASNTTAALAQNWEKITKVLSSQAGEYSFEGDKWGDGAGVFTYYLVNGMTGLADRNNNNEVTAQELYIYMLDNIGRETNFSQNPTLVGNMTSTLAWVDSRSLALLEEKMNDGTNELLAMKGIESMYEKQLDKKILAQYKKFKDCLEKDWLVPEFSKRDNAWDIYNILIENEKAKVIHNHIKRSLLAALQNKSQIIINDYLAAEDEDKSYDYDRASKELDYAFELCDTNYILFDDIRARSLLFSCVNNYYSPEEKLDLLEAAVDIQPDAAYLHNQLGTIYDDIENYDDAIQSYRKAVELSQTFPYAYYNLGITYNNLEQHDKAIDSYLKAIEFKPNYATAYYNLGRSYDELEQYTEALQSYKKAIELNPDFYSAYLNLGIIYDELEQYDNTLELYLNMIEYRPYHADAYYGLGRAYYNLDQYDHAIESYIKAIELQPDYPDACYSLGNAYYNLDQYEKAIESYIMAIELKPDYIDAHYYIGMAFYYLELYEEAIENYLNVIELQSDYPDAYYYLGNAYHNLEQYDNANESYIKAIELQPEYPDAYFFLGRTYYNLNQYVKAIESFKMAIELKPGDPDVYYALGSAYYSLTQYDKAIEYFNRFIEIEHNDPDAYTFLGSSYLQLEQWDNAIEAYLKLIEIKPEDPDGYTSLGTAYLICEQFDKAIESYQKAIEFKPDDPMNHYFLGLYYFQTEQYNKGVECFIRAIELNETDYNSYNWLGNCYLKTENYNQALESFERAIELNPDDASNYYNKACLYSLQNDIDESLIWFEKSLKKGYIDWDHIAGDSDLDNIRDTEQFNSLVSEYSK